MSAPELEKTHRKSALEIFSKPSQTFQFLTQESQPHEVLLANIQFCSAGKMFFFSLIFFSSVKGYIDLNCQCKITTKATFL